jgi:hypothetical protein
MTNSPRPAAIRFDRLIQADPGGVADAREELSRWLLQEFDLDSVRFNDMVLAVYEALANAAEFAYLTAETAGSVTLAAEHDSASSALTQRPGRPRRHRHLGARDHRADGVRRCRSRRRAQRRRGRQLLETTKPPALDAGGSGCRCLRAPLGKWSLVATEVGTRGMLDTDKPI